MKTRAEIDGRLISPGPAANRSATSFCTSNTAIFGLIGPLRTLRDDLICDVVRNIAYNNKIVWQSRSHRKRISWLMTSDFCQKLPRQLAPDQHQTPRRSPPAPAPVTARHRPGQYSTTVFAQRRIWSNGEAQSFNRLGDEAIMPLNGQVICLASSDSLKVCCTRTGYRRSSRHRLQRSNSFWKTRTEPSTVD